MFDDVPIKSPAEEPGFLSSVAMVGLIRGFEPDDPNHLQPHDSGADGPSHLRPPSVEDERLAGRPDG